MFPLLIYISGYELLYYSFILIISKIHWCLLFLSGRASWFWGLEGNIYRSTCKKIAILLYIFTFKCFLSLTSFIVIFIVGKLAILGTQLNVLMVISFVHKNKVYHGTKLLQVSGPWVHQWSWTAQAWTQTCLVTVDMSGGHWALGQPSVPVPAPLASLEHHGMVPLKGRTLSQSTLPPASAPFPCRTALSVPWH